MRKLTCRHGRSGQCKCWQQPGHTSDFYSSCIQHTYPATDLIRPVRHSQACSGLGVAPVSPRALAASHCQSAQPSSTAHMMAAWQAHGQRRISAAIHLWHKLQHSLHPTCCGDARHDAYPQTLQPQTKRECQGVFCHDPCREQRQQPCRGSTDWGCQAAIRPWAPAVQACTWQSSAYLCPKSL